MDERVGKAGEYPPTKTVSGLPARKPFGRVRGLGNGYYCVVDPFPTVDVDVTVVALKQTATPTTRKRKAADDSE